MSREATIEQAQSAAIRRGMLLTPPRDAGGLARVYCPHCGWGKHLPNDGFDVVPEKYAAEPHGCPRCAGELDRDSEEAA